MRPLHETTLALLRHLRGLPQLAAPPIDWGLVNAWEAAGHPDIEPTPESDRLAGLEARLASLESGVRALAEQHAKTAERVASRADQLDRVANRVAVLTRKLDEPIPTAPTAPPPSPARFVPTEPGWYWLEGGDRIREVVRLSGKLLCLGYPVADFRWLGPVAPYAPPARTREQARQAPRRGDRWAMPDGRAYTVLGPAPGGGYSIRQEDDVEVQWPASMVGEWDEKFLGNFAHELEEP